MRRDGAASRWSGLHWRGPGRVALSHALARGALERVAPGGARSRGRPGRQARARRHRRVRLADRKPVVGRPVRSRSRPARSAVSRVCARYLVWSPELGSRTALPRLTATPPIVPRLSWGADESIRRGPPTLRACGAVRDRPPHGGAERLHAAPRPRRSSRRSSSTTCRETAGTTSATTSSSTASARSTRDGSAGSTAMWSARTP